MTNETKKLSLSELLNKINSETAALKAEFIPLRKELAQKINKNIDIKLINNCNNLEEKVTKLEDDSNAKNKQILELAESLKKLQEAHLSLYNDYEESVTIYNSDVVGKILSWEENVLQIPLHEKALYKTTEAAKLFHKAIDDLSFKLEELKKHQGNGSHPNNVSNLLKEIDNNKQKILKTEELIKEQNAHLEKLISDESVKLEESIAQVAVAINDKIDEVANISKTAAEGLLLLDYKFTHNLTHLVSNQCYANLTSIDAHSHKFVGQNSSPDDTIIH